MNIVDGAGYPEWSVEVEQAAWIGGRLDAFGSGVVTSVVPGGFDAYARLLHPVETPRRGSGRTVRWAEVAAWSGLPLVPGAQFHDVALPEHTPSAAAPWTGQGPEQGTLSGDDATALIAVLAGYTTTPQRCWFCLWDGCGWDNTVALASTNEVPAATSGPRVMFIQPPDPVPAKVRAGPRVSLPCRDYLLYRGGIEAALAFVDSEGQTPNLWWAADRAWCVASEIDLAWSYVGGSAAMIEHLLADPRLEAQPVTAAETCHQRVAGWLAQKVDDAVGRLLVSGEATIETSRGTLCARLERPGRGKQHRLRVDSVRSDGSTGSASSLLAHGHDQQLRQQVWGYLTGAVIAFVGG